MTKGRCNEVQLSETAVSTGMTAFRCLHRTDVHKPFHTGAPAAASPGGCSLGLPFSVATEAAAAAAAGAEPRVLGLPRAEVGLSNSSPNAVAAHNLVRAVIYALRAAPALLRAVLKGLQACSNATPSVEGSCCHIVYFKAGWLTLTRCVQLGPICAQKCVEEISGINASAIVTHPDTST